MIVVKGQEYDTTTNELVTPIDGDPVSDEQLQSLLDNGHGMQLATRVYRNIEAKLGIEDLNERSAIFRHVMVNGFGKTKQCASTYLYNIRNGMYASNKRWNKKARELAKQQAEASTEAATLPEVEVTEPVAEQPVVEAPQVLEPVVATAGNINEDDRWGVWDNIKDGLIATFATRGGAQEYNRQQKEQGNDTKLWDRTKHQANG